MDTTDYGSDSEFSEWYDSSSDEEEYEGDSPRFNKRMSPAKDFLPDQYGNVLVSEFSGVPVSPSSSAKLKSALKSFGSHNRDSPSTDSPCSALSPSLSSSYSSPRSGRSSVQLVEPIEEISALKELRKSFRYIENANCARPVSGLPSSPRDGVKINESWGYKVFQRTPPATSSAARLKWEESKLNLR
ncbi:expressed protein [Phakopsora pachyrhizi]|uniref:Expressed protein n=1 Tax=Phakopsora pachyrhizi TaxID=170000 RepID=A0AAV0B2S5_PHAPC|nr:expressed protein [Phakopsora pachyrhizi]CAH7689441.1 expressed protein [Phakopsora pachyrhizi]